MQREQLSLTRERLALQAGTSTSTIARLELSDHVPNPRAVVAIAHVLGLPVEALLPVVSA